MDELKLLQKFAEMPAVLKEVLKDNKIDKQSRKYFEDLLMSRMDADEHNPYRGLALGGHYGYEVLLTYPRYRYLIEKLGLTPSPHAVIDSIKELGQRPPVEDYRMYLELYKKESYTIRDIMLLMPDAPEYKSEVEKTFNDIQATELTEYRQDAANTTSGSARWYRGFSLIRDLVGKRNSGAAFRAPNGLMLLPEIADSVYNLYERTSSQGVKSDMRAIIAGMNITADKYKELWVKYDKAGLRGALAENESLPADYVETVSKYRDPDILRGFVRNSKCPEWILIRSTQSKDYEVSKIAKERVQDLGEKLNQEEGQ